MGKAGAFQASVAGPSPASCTMLLSISGKSRDSQSRVRGSIPRSSTKRRAPGCNREALPSEESMPSRAEYALLV